MLGYCIIEASDGREALQILADGIPVDLLFTDVVMPGGLSGPELVGEARALRPTLPVLYTSGFPEASRDGGGLCGKGDPLLSKPYRLQDLARRIAEALASGRTRRDDDASGVSGAWTGETAGERRRASPHIRMRGGTGQKRPRPRRGPARL